MPGMLGPNALAAEDLNRQYIDSDGDGSIDSRAYVGTDANGDGIPDAVVGAAILYRGELVGHVGADGNQQPGTGPYNTV